MSFRYARTPTPFGDALAVFSEKGLIAFDLSAADHPEAPWLLESVASRLGSLPEPDPRAADDLASLLDRYFDGEPVRFDTEIALDWSLAEGFTLAALQEICQIPWAETASYGEIAIRAGSPGAARAVGTACRLTPFSIVVPVHRVIKADGTPGHYGSHPEHKRFLLDLESGAWGRARPSVAGMDG